MEFKPTVSVLRGAAQDNSFREVFELFYSITRMDENELVAAYQTMHHAALCSGKTEDRHVQAILKAIIAQMISSIYESYVHRDRRKAKFEAVVGFRLTRDPFEEIFEMFRL